jgi:hypothetical protein
VTHACKGHPIPGYSRYHSSKFSSIILYEDSIKWPSFSTYPRRVTAANRERQREGFVLGFNLDSSQSGFDVSILDQERPWAAETDHVRVQDALVGVAVLVAIDRDQHAPERVDTK